MAPQPILNTPPTLQDTQPLHDMKLSAQDSRVIITSTLYMAHTTHRYIHIIIWSTPDFCSAVSNGLFTLSIRSLHNSWKSSLQYQNTVSRPPVTTDRETDRQERPTFSFFLTHPCRSSNTRYSLEWAWHWHSSVSSASRTHLSVVFLHEDLTTRQSCTLSWIRLQSVLTTTCQNSYHLVTCRMPWTKPEHRYDTIQSLGLVLKEQSTATKSTRVSNNIHLFHCPCNTEIMLITGNFSYFMCKEHICNLSIV